MLLTCSDLFLLNFLFSLIGRSLYPQAGWVEIDPDVLWLQFVAVIKESVKGNWIYKSRDGNMYFVYNRIL